MAMANKTPVKNGSCLFMRNSFNGAAKTSARSLAEG